MERLKLESRQTKHQVRCRLGHLRLQSNYKRTPETISTVSIEQCSAFEHEKLIQIYFTTYYLFGLLKETYKKS